MPIANVQPKTQPTKERFKRANELKSAALDVFAERDFASVTIKDIACAIGVNTALIYYYFESKEDLFRATIENAVVQALDIYKHLKEKHDDPLDLINAPWTT